jgi:hypothetical protein
VSWYLTIRSDSRYSQLTTTAELVEFLAAIWGLRQTGLMAFQAAEGSPWVSVVLAKCGPEGSYSVGEEFLPQINVVELVCSEYSDPAWYDALASRIAEFLGWSAFEDHPRRQVWPVG